MSEDGRRQADRSESEGKRGCWHSEASAAGAQVRGSMFDHSRVFNHSRTTVPCTFYCRTRLPAAVQAHHHPHHHHRRQHLHHHLLPTQQGEVVNSASERCQCWAYANAGCSWQHSTNALRGSGERARAPCCKSFGLRLVHIHQFELSDLWRTYFVNPTITVQVAWQYTSSWMACTFRWTLSR